MDIIDVSVITFVMVGPWFTVEVETDVLVVLLLVVETTVMEAVVAAPVTVTAPPLPLP